MVEQTPEERRVVSSILTRGTMRPWFNGRTLPCQGRDRGSIPLGRSIKTPFLKGGFLLYYFHMNPEANIERHHESPLSEVYKLLGASSPLEMSNLYTDKDQELMHSDQWDYDNPELITNKVKNILEELDKSNLNEDELDWSNEVLWFWYHHAISCAIKKNDQNSAQKYATKALELQHDEHPNQITKLLYLLVHDKLQEAKKWANTITEEPEKSTAQYQLEIYKNKGYFH